VQAHGVANPQRTFAIDEHRADIWSRPVRARQQFKAVALYKGRTMLKSGDANPSVDR
jgi:hypothetical protein